MKIGDKVICIADWYSYGNKIQTVRLTVGKIYLVQGTSNNTSVNIPNEIFIMNDDNVLRYYYTTHFKTIQEHRDFQLNRLLK